MNFLVISLTILFANIYAGDHADIFLLSLLFLKIAHGAVSFRAIFIVCCGCDLKIWSSHAGLSETQPGSGRFYPRLDK